MYKYMRDILPEEKIPEAAKNLSWYIEELLLSYKYDMKQRYFKSLTAIKDLLPKQIYLILESIGENRICWQERR